MPETLIIEEEQVVVVSDTEVEVISVGVQGPPGSSGPNEITSSTTTDLNGVLKGNGSNVGVATNLAFTDAANTFTAQNTFNQKTTVNVAGSGPGVVTNSASNKSVHIRLVPVAGNTDLIQVRNTTDTTTIIGIRESTMKVGSTQGFHLGALSVYPNSTTQVGLAIGGQNGQTEDLTQWKSWNGNFFTDIASVSATGAAVFAGATINGQTTINGETVHNDVSFFNAPVLVNVLEEGVSITHTGGFGLSVTNSTDAKTLTVNGSTITTGDGTTPGVNGTDADLLLIQTGTGGNATGPEYTAGSGGDVQIKAGNGGTTGLSGGGNGGNVVLQAGSAGSGLDGQINLNGPGGTTVASVTSSAFNVNTESFFSQLIFATAGVFAETASIIGQQLRAENWTAGQTPLVVRGADGQTAPLVEVKDSTETVLVYVDATGKLTANNAELMSLTTSQVEVGDVVNVGANVFTPSIGDNSGTTGIGFNSGTGTISLNAFAGIQFPSTDDATAANSTVYYSTDLSKLVFKDPSGTVHPLY